VRISGLSLGSHGTKSHLGVGLMARHKIYYKGEGGGCPQVLAVVNFVRLNDYLSFFLITSQSSSMPL
jgi:hypothetical protein